MPSKKIQSAECQLRVESHQESSGSSSAAMSGSSLYPGRVGLSLGSLGRVGVATSAACKCRSTIIRWRRLALLGHERSKACCDYTRATTGPWEDCKGTQARSNRHSLAHYTCAPRLEPTPTAPPVPLSASAKSLSPRSSCSKAFEMDSEFTLG